MGLYAILLLSLCCMIAPPVPRKVQAWLQDVLCLPLRAWVVLAEPPAARASRETTDQALIHSLRRRQSGAALASRQRWAPEGFEPVLCRVVERRGRGGAGLPSVLVLDRTRAELAGAASAVTSGDRLLGFLQSREQAVADDGDAVGPAATVALLHHRPKHGGPRRAAAAVMLDGVPLRFVIEPTRRIDVWPLRCRLLEDPHRASTLRHSGVPVHTVALANDPLGRLPAGLQLGRLQVWGYPGRAPIDLFVEPIPAPRTISVVVVWCPRRLPPRRELAVPLARGRVEPVQLLPVPAPPPAGRRWVVSAGADTTLATDAALVRGTRLLGTLERGGSRFGLAAPFGSTGRAWSLTLLPTDPRLAPVDLEARSLGRAVGEGTSHVRLEVVTPEVALVPGMLFTGPNGRQCPAGLLLGPAEPQGGELVCAVGAVGSGGDRNVGVFLRAAEESP